MPTEYKFRLRSPAGVLRQEFNNVKSFSYTRKLNDPGLLTMDVFSDHVIVSLLQDNLDSIMEVWRRDRTASINWYCDFRGLYRDEMREADLDGQISVRFYFPGPLSKLRRVIVAYQGDKANRAVFTATPVETIMNNLVKYNATSAGTTGDGRIRNVDLLRVAVEANGAYGTAIDFACQYRTVLDVLQEITRMAPGDFDMVYIGSGVFEYRFYKNHLGSDLSATVIFSMKRNNMEGPVYQKNRLNDRTVAIVLGDGDEGDREEVVRIPEYSNYDADDNSIEYFVDGRGAGSTDQLQAIGDASIFDVRAQSRLTFRVLETKSTRYGRDYNLGDLVTGVFETVRSETLKVMAATIGMDGSGNEVIQIDMVED